MQFHSNICQRWDDTIDWWRSKLPDSSSAQFFDVRTQKSSNRKTLFADGDFHESNILVDNGHVVGIVGWQDAGWYDPELYWEYVTTIFG